MKIKEVAKLLDTTESTIRVGLQQGVFDFGVAFNGSAQNLRYLFCTEFHELIFVFL